MKFWRSLLSQGIKRTKEELSWLSCQLLPPHCQLCRAPLTTINSSTSTSLCYHCATQCKTSAADCCPRCNEPYATSSVTRHYCSQCLRHPPQFLWLKTAGIYTETMASAIHQFKYQGRASLAKPLAQCIITQLAQDITAYQPDLIIPVPLHSSRLKERGYNQSVLLARHLGKEFQIPVCTKTLFRNRPTSPQTLLNATQRRNNLRGVFEIRQTIPPKQILLIDDVVTTTSTARSCAHLLTTHGHTVAVIALGRASL
ncbi:MAG: ComF family protein [Thermodesulfobacteriota bacterium]|nr:ComF family protein [Thermodesulfobacteriota bacterium]